jgi:hypothetical protein
MPSAPLRQTHGEPTADSPEREVPSSAGIGTSKGKKSFLRPFLLGGRKKKGVEIPAAVMHKSRKEEESAGEGLVDDHLQVDLETPETPYEDSAEISKYDDSQPSPVWAPLGKGKKGTSKRVVEMQIEEGVPTSPGVMTPISAKAPLTPIIPITPISPSNVLSPILTPTTALIQLTPIEIDIPFSPVPITPITTPPSPTESSPGSPILTTPIVTTSQSSSHRESARHSDHGGDRLQQHHRKPEETSDERRKREEREHIKRKRGPEGERRSRSSRNDVEREDTWLEIVFEDLPFGPDKNMVSPLLFPSTYSPLAVLQSSQGRY